jgi:hypothetical protein
LVGIWEIETGEKLDLNSIELHRFEFSKGESERQAVFETNFDSEESTESIMRLIKTSGLV